MREPTPEQRRVPVEDGQLSLEVAGSGPALLLIHSGITDSGMWDDQLPAFSRHFRTAYYDLRGFGGSSDIEGPYSHVDDLRAVLSAVEFERPRVVAASMGARVALDLAVEEPDRFERMVLVGPAVSGLPFDDPHFHEYWRRIIEAYEADDIEGAIELETELWVNGPTRPAGTEHPDAFERVLWMQRDIWSRAPDDDPEREIEPPAAERLGVLEMPIFVIVGEHDVSDIHRNARQIVADAADATMTVMPGLGHLPNLEDPETFNRLALDFLLA